jgi:hypothetical protein
MILEGKTTLVLLEMMLAIESDPKNRMPAGHLYLYIPKARKKLEKIARQITYNLAEKRKADGNPVPTCGYSGMKQNRRR